MRRLIALATVAALALPACRSAPAPRPAPAQTISLSSPAFVAGGEIDVRFTCDGAGVSPPLRWTAPPAGTQQLALVALDPDAPGGSYAHWVVWGIDPAARGVDEGETPPGGRRGRNDAGTLGYAPPCPPRGGAHAYVFTLFALAGPPLTEDGEALRDGARPNVAVEAISNANALALGRLSVRYLRR